MKDRARELTHEQVLELADLVRQEEVTVGMEDVQETSQGLKLLFNGVETHVNAGYDGLIHIRMDGEKLKFNGCWDYHGGTLGGIVQGGSSSEILTDSAPQLCNFLYSIERRAQQLDDGFETERDPIERPMSRLDVSERFMHLATPTTAYIRVPGERDFTGYWDNYSFGWVGYLKGKYLLVGYASDVMKAQQQIQDYIDM